jgi:hypothetical protein
LSCSIAPVATSSFSGWQSSARTASARPESKRAWARTRVSADLVRNCDAAALKRDGTRRGGAGRGGAVHRRHTRTHTPNKNPHLGLSPPMLYCTVVHTRARFHDGRSGFRHWRSELAQRACVCGYDLLHLPRLHVPHVNKPSTGPFQDAALAIQRARMTVRTVHVVLTVPRRRGGRQRVRCPRVFHAAECAACDARRCVARRCALQAESCEMRVASDGSRAPHGQHATLTTVFPPRRLY